MIDPKVISRVRNGVCAVGYLSVPYEVYKQDIQKPFFNIVGTGFLIRETTVITNSHVIKVLYDIQADLGFPPSQFFLEFVDPQEDKKMVIKPRMIRRLFQFENNEPDVGFLEFSDTEGHFRNIIPLDIISSFDLNITEEIAICGYPFGTSLLTKNEKVYRWGPVIQRGFISAISPIDIALEPDEILLDVRIAGGMSGSPIFRPSTGEVIGINHSMRGATTAFGLPFTKQKVNAWLDQYDHFDNWQEIGNQNQDILGMLNVDSS